MDWPKWNGRIMKRSIFSIVNQRGVFDLFSNTYCPPISLSHLMCNSNIQLLLPGPHGTYVTKYLTKPTGNDDQYDYKKTFQKMHKGLDERTKETDYGEGFKRLLRASFLHTSENIIGPSLAKYLTVYQKRFIFSHEFIYIPTDDIYKIMRREGTIVNVQKHGKKTYLENFAYHYIYRPDELQDYDPISFYEKFEFKKRSKKLDEGEKRIYYFLVEHPNHKQLCVCKRDIPLIAKFRTYDFGDAGKFKVDITNGKCKPNSELENHAKMILLHFMSYRSIDDLSGI